MPWSIEREGRFEAVPGNLASALEAERISQIERAHTDTSALSNLHYFNQGHAHATQPAGDAGIPQHRDIHTSRKVGPVHVSRSFASLGPSPAVHHSRQRAPAFTHDQSIVSPEPSLGDLPLQHPQQLRTHRHEPPLTHAALLPVRRFTATGIDNEHTDPITKHLHISDAQAKGFRGPQRSEGDNREEETQSATVPLSPTNPFEKVVTLPTRQLELFVRSNTGHTASTPCVIYPPPEGGQEGP